MARRKKPRTGRTQTGGTAFNEVAGMMVAAKLDGIRAQAAVRRPSTPRSKVRHAPVAPRADHFVGDAPPPPMQFAVPTLSAFHRLQSGSR